MQALAGFGFGQRRSAAILGSPPILDYANKHHPGKFTRIDVRFRGALCYIDAYTEPGVPRGSTSPAGETREQWIERLRRPPRISAGFATLEARIDGVSLGTAMPTKSTNPAFGSRAKTTARPKRLSRRQPTSCDEVSGNVTAHSVSDSVGALLPPVARLCFQSGKTMGEVTVSL